jgi:hypothetical protein
MGGMVAEGRGPCQAKCGEMESGSFPVPSLLGDPYLPRPHMATVKPFAALRPSPGAGGKICELPYDVMSAEEARRMAEGNPLSFLRVSRPEIELPAGD